MRALSLAQLVTVWEHGVGQGAADRMLTLLAAAHPDTPGERLEALPVGQRDADFLRLRELTLGSTLRGVADCPRCGERLEFTLSSDTLKCAEPSAGASGELAVDDVLVRFRAPTSADLCAAAACRDARSGGRLIAERCIIDLSKDGTALTPDEISDEVFDRLAARLAEQEPGAELLLDVACGACGHHWQPLLDIGAFFWAEIDAVARRLLREVHVLARAYGWREADILAMGAARRRVYLEMVG